MAPHTLIDLQSHIDGSFFDANSFSPSLAAGPPRSGRSLESDAASCGNSERPTHSNPSVLRQEEKVVMQHFSVGSVPETCLVHVHVVRGVCQRIAVPDARIHLPMQVPKTSKSRGAPCEERN
ncbi:hypothetical protein MJO28_004312 [Puccinia striiformis f. sp. tritici]|uniref:Uncharacterized protein n=4 Tax=Puccinia striiformis TaxID=27350 RepID=A0A0L0VFC2_9BASI|nr:hypothetical protein MJO28_004312 [Puccinia striiformis f. sp. tritici]KAI9616297.1 hypothetical protein KEM48_005211 [Puccinia striiformis f. sp. tritici PST-130]KNE97714.1 hypothetical protein PSTG_08935 [Puccinia striiformis f. sp. tritici PST-78]POV98601.1 hypothetical protein PSTT_14286 [Puccinia striiformis]POW01128.1 hypothetical protein PSHT_12703 [Puccinia striiformis]